MEKDDFLKKLEKLVEHAKSKHNTLDAGEINDFFTGDNLSPEQMDQIYSYLEGRKIRSQSNRRVQHDNTHDFHDN